MGGKGHLGEEFSSVTVVKLLRQGEGKEGKKVVKEENSMMMERKWKKQHDSAEHKVNVEREGDGE